MTRTGALVIGLIMIVIFAIAFMHAEITKPCAVHSEISGPCTVGGQPAICSVRTCLVGDGQ